MKRLKDRMFSGDAGNVLKGMMTLALGSGAGRAIGFLSMPVITRIYAPEDFGVLTVFIALVSVLARLVRRRYVMALPLPRHDGMAMNLLVVSAGLIGALSAAFAFCLWMWRDALLAVLSMEQLAPWWWLLAISVLGTAIYELMSLWGTRKRSYKVMSRSSVTQSFLGAGIKIGLGFAGLRPEGLLLGQLAAQAGGLGIMWRTFGRGFKANLRHVNLRRLKLVVMRYRGFAIYRTPSQLLFNFTRQAPAFFSAAIYGVATAGQLGLALSIIAVPLGLFGTSVGRALYAEAASIGMREPHRVRKLVRKVQLQLFFVGLVPALLFFFFGVEVFDFVFGSAWSQAGEFASLVSVYLLFQFVSAPLMQAINLLDIQHMFLVINIIRVGIVAAIAGLAYSIELSAEGFVGSYAVAMALIYAVLMIWIDQRFGRAAHRLET